MNGKFHLRTILFIAVGLAAAACAAPQDTGDRVATVVAATMQAQVVPTLTSAPIDGEIRAETPPAYADCANTGQISIVYLKNGNLWFWVQGGDPQQLTNSGDVQDVKLSQDGCRVAFTHTVPNPAYDPGVEFPLPENLTELWVVNSDGSGVHPIVTQDFYATLPAPAENTAYDLYGFEWQPGSHTLAFGTRTAFTGPGLVPNNDIYLVDADTALGPADISTLLPIGQGGAFFFSPDGGQVAFTTPTNANVINVDGSNLRSNLISFPMVITYSEYQYYPPVHWSPDGNSFMVAVPPEDGLAEPVDGVYPETTLWYVPLDGTPPIEAGAIQAVWFATQAVQFSPDTGRIAYLRQYGEPQANQFELVLALSDGSNESLGLQINEIRFGDWAPDNTRFIYWFSQAGVVSLFHGSAASLEVTPISTLTPFEAASAVVEWIEADTFALLLVGNAGAELSLMDISGAGMLIDTMATPFVAFDVAH